MDLSPYPFMFSAAVAGLILAAIVARVGHFLCEQHRFRACKRALADEELFLRLLLRRGPDAAPGTREAFLMALRDAARQTRCLDGERRAAAERRQAELMYLASTPAVARTP